MRLKSGERGVAAVELAIVIPFVFLLCASAVAIGNAWRANLRLETAANEAVRLCGVRGAEFQEACLARLISPTTVSENCVNVNASIDSGSEPSFGGASAYVSRVRAICQFELLPGISAVPKLQLAVLAEGVSN